jgi:hypothetical protein
MNKDRAFARRIKALYEKQGADGGDLRSEELSTMFDLFLGKTYDERRKIEIARVQKDLHNKQEHLAKEFHAGELNAEQYFNSLSPLIGEAFAECRRILGPKDFRRLFGASHTKEKDIADRSAFLESTATKHATQPSFEDFRREHRHWQVTVYYHDGEKFARVYTDRAKATRFADRKKKSPVVKLARVVQIS